ncbi:glycosyltransferase [Streptomyces decoyicus]|uniref:Glycosyltransferase n=1 Tax=Streptomyces decoyicus TaxID=249567 RepID=A0ABZ1F8R7_9ACTN|nr:glycosyltransferase [Streptomyces decoyicus]WSB66635.1 glycosyltransferase [Streptomyces decoyicus]
MNPEAIAVLIPAHNEEELLPRALAAVAAAARHPALAKLHVLTVVAADACVDDTAKVAREAGASVLHLGSQNPGKARSAAAQHAMATLGTSATATWIASTDADSAVPPHWLAFQLDQARAGWEAVIGTVTVPRWPPVPHLADRHHELYNASRPAGGESWRHPHVHGANLGVTAEAYQEVGGFPALPVGEDHALVSALERNGHRVLRTPDCPVETSSRLRPRAVGGFGDHLAQLAAEEGVMH